MISSESGGVREANSSLPIVSFMLCILATVGFLVSSVMCQRLTTEDGRIPNALFGLEPMICVLLLASCV